MIRTRMTRQSGLTIVEMMVAMAVSLLIVGAVIMVYLASKQTFRSGEAIARHQESIRIAADSLAFDLRLAGNLGCRGDLDPIDPKQVLPLVSPDSENVNFSEPLKGYRGGSGSFPPGLTAGEVNPGTDIVRVKFASSSSWRLPSPGMLTAADLVTVRGNRSEFITNNVMVISDCEKATLFAISGDPADGAITGTAVLSHDSPPNSSASVAKIYGTDANVFRLISRIYYVATVGGRSALYRRSLLGGTMTVEEVADGIEDMQILFGEDDNKEGGSESTESTNRRSNWNVTRYVQADGVADWNRVRSVQVCLTYVSSENGVTTEPQRYFDCSGALVTPTDRRYRQSFTMTISVRNRLP